MQNISASQGSDLYVLTREQAQTCDRMPDAGLGLLEKHPCLIISASLQNFSQNFISCYKPGKGDFERHKRVKKIQILLS